MNIKDLYEEALHSYRIYIECSGVLETHQAKLALLKWPDVAGAAIECFIAPSGERLAMLADELKSVVLEPVKTIHKATCDRYTQLTNEDPRDKHWYTKNLTLESSDTVSIKNMLIKQINCIFNELHKITKESYPEFKIYDNSIH